MAQILITTFTALSFIMIFYSIWSFAHAFTYKSAIDEKPSYTAPVFAAVASLGMFMLASYTRTRSAKEESTKEPRELTGVEINTDILAWVGVIIGGLVALALIAFSLKKVSQALSAARRAKEEEQETYLKNRDHMTSLIDIYNKIREEYAKAETSPDILLDAPLMLDTHFPATREFHRSLATADTAIAYAKTTLTKPTTEDVKHLATTVADLHDTWIALKTEAFEIGIPLISARTSRRAKRLLSQVLDESITREERRAYSETLIELLNDNLNTPHGKASEEMRRVISVIKSKLENAVEHASITPSKKATLMLESEK